MKKILMTALLAVFTVCAVFLTACNRESDKINADSEIVSVTVTAADGYKFELNAEQTKFVADTILRAGEFEKDVKISVVGWEFEYDYKFVFKVIEKKFLFKKEEKTVSYALGTTKTRTDTLGEQHKGYHKQEWTNFSSLTGSRVIAESTEQDAAAVHELLQNIIDTERLQKYERIKAQFITEGFAVTDLSGNDLTGIDGEEEFIFLNARYGFEARKQSSGEYYKVFYVTVQKAKDVFAAFHGRDCRKNDVFVGCGVIPQADSILDRVFAVD